MDINGYTQQEAANSLTLWAIGLIVGCTLWTYVADRVVKTRKVVICTGAVIYGFLWVLLAVKPDGLPAGVLQVAMFWGGFFASTWIPAYAQLKEAVPPQVVATAMGMLNLLFWLGGPSTSRSAGLFSTLSRSGADTSRSPAINRLLRVPGLRGPERHSRRVQQRTTQEEPMTIKRMLCASDFSPASRPALRLAQELARTLKARLILFHAYEISVPIGDGGYLPPSVMQEMLTATRDAAAQSLKRLARSSQGTGVRMSTLLAEGPAAAAIIRAAKKQRVNLVVMGTHGRTGVRRLLMGSVADRVIRTASCPVLVVGGRH